MITDLAKSVAYDALRAIRKDGFFEAGKRSRKKIIQEILGDDYPDHIVTYLKDVDGDAFAEDLSEIIEIISSSSLISEAKRLSKKKNGFFLAFVDALKSINQYSGTKTGLWMTLKNYEKAGSLYARILKREMQTLLLEAKNEDSPIIQVARKQKDIPEKLPGIPSIQVKNALLGGARSFYQGELIDDSWKGRLTQLLSVK